MPSGNAASGDPKLHPELRSDHLEFSCALKPWLDARGGAGVEVLNLLTRYGSMVYEQSARLSLIAGADRAHLFTRHVLDSLNPVSLFPSPPPSGVDIGSGAGFPGIPLAIVWPSSRMTLIESREKKAGFLEKVSRELGLRNVIVRCQRLEALAHEEAGREALGEAFEAAFIRAVANPTGIVAELETVCSPGGTWVYFLGLGARGERAIAAVAGAGIRASIATGQFGGKLLQGQFSRSPADRG